jgi:hypothetical protein
MMRGMIYLHGDVPVQVTRLYGTTAANTASAPVRQVEVTRLDDPTHSRYDLTLEETRDVLTIAPGCDVCGKAPGFTVCHYDGTHDQDPCCLLYREHYPQDHEYGCPVRTHAESTR